MGELILGRKDDGMLEIIRADDDFEIADDLLEDMPEDGDYYRERDVIHINASNGRLAYVLAEHDEQRHVWRLIRTADREGR